MVYTTKTGVTIDRAELVRYELERLSDRSIAKKYGISAMALVKIRRNMGWPRVHELRYRSDKGKIRVPLEEQRERHLAYMREYMSGKDKRYKSVRVGGRTVSEHRLVVEGVLGRKLRKGEVVHHIDGDRQNNEKSNLLVCSQGYHLELHRRMRLRDAQETVPEK